MGEYLDHSISEKERFVQSGARGIVAKILQNSAAGTALDHYRAEGPIQRVFYVPGLTLNSKAGEKVPAILKVWKNGKDFPEAAFEPCFFDHAASRSFGLDLPCATFLVTAYGKWGLIQEDLTTQGKYDVRSLSTGLQELNLSNFLPSGFRRFQHWESLLYQEIARTIDEMCSSDCGAVSSDLTAGTNGRIILGSTSYFVSEGTKVRRIVTADVDQLSAYVQRGNCDLDLSSFKDLVYEF